MLFETFSQEVYLYSESRVLTMLSLIHSFCQHAGNVNFYYKKNFIQ